MNWHDLQSGLRDFSAEFLRVKYGLVGVALLIIFVALSLFEPLLSAYPGAATHWRDITYWENNPKNAAPVWVNWFSAEKKAPQLVLGNPEMTLKKQGNVQNYTSSFRYNYNYNAAPNDLIFRAFGQGTVNLRIQLKRPDGRKVELYSKVLTLNGETPVRIPLGKVAKEQAAEFAKTFTYEFGGAAQEIMSPLEILFSVAKTGMLENPEPLKGSYEVKVQALTVGAGAYLKDAQLLVAGNVMGILGTDSSGRDLWSGILAGTKWALFIGLLTSAISVIIGVFYGVICAYCGGWVDSLGMRIYDIFQSIPMLPVLIVLSAIFKPSIWVLVLVMCILFWVSSVRTVRSIALQLKEETYIEAAKALGASPWRIIFRHLAPQVVPFSFASMALMVPTAIVTEASVSLLGLGDANMVTWGQILHDAMSGGAMLQGLWWWIIPPGLFIALMGMTFAFVGFVMDTILNPKLKTR